MQESREAAEIKSKVCSLTHFIISWVCSKFQSKNRNLCFGQVCHISYLIKLVYSWNVNKLKLYYILLLSQYYCIDAPFGLKENNWKKSKIGITWGFCMISGPNYGSSTLYVQPYISHYTTHPRQRGYEGHCWKSKGDVLLWTPTHEHTSIG